MDAGEKRMSLSGLKLSARWAATAVIAMSMSGLATAQDTTTNAPAPQPSQPAADASLPQAPAATTQVPIQQRITNNYAKGVSHFPNPIAPYRPHHIDNPNFTNTARIDQFFRDGKLYLSMDDAVALALENNLDIAIARYNLNVADTDILRSKAGGSILGVNTGIVQNTPGGGVGGLGGQVGSGTGGTSAGSGGAGTGTGGIVGSTLGLGPVLASFDPIITGTLQSDHNKFACTSPFCGNAQNTSTADVAYNQGFTTGTNVLVGFNNTRTTANNPYSTLSPLLNSNFKFQLTQHLLQGLGFAPNRRFITIAKNDREITDVAFRLQVITTIDQIENMYWDLVFAYENVRVNQESLAFANKTLSDTNKQVQIGTLAPIEVVRAQSTVAADQQTLTIAQTNLQLQQLLMKNALSRTLVDPRLADAEVIPMSTMALSSQEAVVPTQDLINDALSHRADLAEARINLTNSGISSKAIRNALLPTVDLFAYYGGSGVGGDQGLAGTCGSPNAPPTNFCVPPGSIPSTGYTDTLNQLINSTGPDKGMGITVNIPLRNRLAQATQVRAELEYRQAQMRVQQIENQVRIEVRNAQFSLQQNLASVQSAKAAVAYAQQSMDAEQKKLALGASTSTLVLQNESALATSESTLVSAMALYEKARVELDRATGLLLDHTGIQVEDAVRGQVNSMPHVPDITPRKEAPSVSATSSPVQPLAQPTTTQPGDAQPAVPQQ
jgi:outer membrane protein